MTTRILLIILLLSFFSACNSGGGGNSSGGSGSGPDAEIPVTPPGDTTPPTSPVPLYFISQSGQENELALLTGGELSEISADTASLRYYKLSSFSDPSPILVLEVSREKFLSKTVVLPLIEGAINYFKISARDAAGNESGRSNGLAIFSQNSTSLPQPYLSAEAQELNNGAISSPTILLKGFASVQALQVQAYRDASLSILLASTSAANFEEFGLEVPLLLNQENQFFLVAKRQAEFSQAIRYTVTHDNLVPSVPELSPEVIADAQSPYDLSEQAVDLYGEVDADVVEVRVYTSASLAEPSVTLPVNEINGSLTFFGSVSLEIGVNDFYLVAIDAAGNISPTSQISFTRLSSDEE